MKYSFPAFENGFIRAAAASPALRVADCVYNAKQIIGVMREYAEKNVQLLCLPEFALTGYTCSDLFLQDTLLRGAEDGLAAILKASQGLNLVVLVGLPVRCTGKLYNCAAVVCNGELLGLVPKLHLPNYGEFYEKRHFIPGMREPECIELAGQETLIGTNLLFACKQMPAFVLAAEVCEDLWAPVPPSCAHALAGATVVANLSASDETVGKAAYRRELVCGQSVVLVSRGIVQEIALRGSRYTLSDLMEQLRSKDVFELADVEYAILETNGELSVLLKGPQQTPTYQALHIPSPEARPPFMLVQDGEIHHEALSQAGYDETWLHKQLKKGGAACIDDVFFAFLGSDGILHIQRKHETGGEAVYIHTERKGTEKEK